MSRRMDLVLGVGNEARGDDAAGLLTVRQIRRTKQLEVRELRPDGANLLEAWKEKGLVVVVDATSSGAAPGTVSRWDAEGGIPLARRRPPSTHFLGLAQAIELGFVLGQLPERLVVIGIEGKSFRAGAPLSAEVEAGLSRAVQRVLDEIEAWRDRDA